MRTGLLNQGQRKSQACKTAGLFLRTRCGAPLAERAHFTASCVWYVSDTFSLGHAQDARGHTTHQGNSSLLASALHAAEIPKPLPGRQLRPSSKKAIWTPEVNHSICCHGLTLESLCQKARDRSPKLLLLPGARPGAKTATLECLGVGLAPSIPDARFVLGHAF